MATEERTTARGQKLAKSKSVAREAGTDSIYDIAGAHRGVTERHEDRGLCITPIPQARDGLLPWWWQLVIDVADNRLRPFA